MMLRSAEARWFISGALPGEGGEYMGEGYRKILVVTKKTRRRVWGILETVRAFSRRGR